MKKILLILFISQFEFLFSQEYIQIVRPDINIRMSPTTSSPIVGHAFNGEVYITNGENTDWYSVLLPSNETRWIYKRLAKKITFKSALPVGLDVVTVQQELDVAEYEANQDSKEEIIGNLSKLKIQDLLLDRYILLVLQKYSVHPADYMNLIEYEYTGRSTLSQPIAEHLVSVTHVDYDLFKIDFANIYIQTKRCFKLGSALDAMIYIYNEDDQIFQKLCFERGYNREFNNCYNIKNIYSAVLSEPNLVALTNDGKIKKTDLILKETVLQLPE